MRRKRYKTVNLTKINIAHREACAKHPKFCDDFTGASEWFIVDELERWRKVNSGAPYHADAILNEEILEALEAYKQGDLNSVPEPTQMEQEMEQVIGEMKKAIEQKDEEIMRLTAQVDDFQRSDRSQDKNQLFELRMMQFVWDEMEA